ncbi:hypothetical protein [Phytoactinopolyspora mesophila]|uniref:Uncharacterized protein n=1 Tax=Phytoactinopolyspora mesophila TaxID=2650750 RepID=A0A7K3M9M0_9ACTN|nr:hypothetical protein [Phytoactinopolyspora mesophila]NDL60041.1 hypothetical protein [Phytoactinopolyspora mesophila]
MTNADESAAPEEPGLRSAEEPHTPLLRDLKFTRSRDTGNSRDPGKSPNPWLWSAGIFGVVAFVVGMLLFIRGVTDAEDVIVMWWGMVLSFLGMMMVTGALVGGAVCWQLKRNAPRLDPER